MLLHKVKFHNILIIKMIVKFSPENKSEWKTQNPIFISVSNANGLVSVRYINTKMNNQEATVSMIKSSQNIWEGEMSFLLSGNYQIKVHDQIQSITLKANVQEQEYVGFGSHMIIFGPLLIFSLLGIFLWIKKIKS